MNLFNRMQLGIIVRLPVLVTVLLMLGLASVFYYEYQKINNMTESLNSIRLDVEVLDSELLKVVTLTNLLNQKTDNIDQLKQREQEFIATTQQISAELKKVSFPEKEQLNTLLQQVDASLSNRNTLQADSVTTYLNLPWLADKFASIEPTLNRSEQWFADRDKVLILSSHIQDRVANLFTINIPDPEQMLRAELQELTQTLSRVANDAVYNRFISDYQQAMEKVLANRRDANRIQQQLESMMSELTKTLTSVRNDKEQHLADSLADYGQWSETALVGKLVAIAVVIMICLLLTTLINRWQTHWISVVRTNIDKMSQGDFTAKIALAPSDSKNNEFVALSMAFNKTTTQLSSVTSSLLDVAQGVRSHAEEMSQSMLRAKENAFDEVDKITQVSTAVTELSVAAEQVSANAAIADEEAQNALQQVRDGQHSLTQLDVISSDVNQAMQNATEVIEQLNSHAQEIGTVIDVINNISEQTNLLALNAAIEAARAGESGRGFAVVADEVRNLAAKTQQSTVSIQKLIEQLQSQSKYASEIMVKNAELVEESKHSTNLVQGAFGHISTAVEKISEMNATVATASEEQSRVTQDIFQNVSHVNELISTNGEFIANGAQSSQDLSQMSEQQAKLLSNFKYSA